jgi:Helix-turn-helix domain
MRFEIDEDRLRPLVEQIASDVSARLERSILEAAAKIEAAGLGGRIGLTEEEAASAIGVPRATLQNLRRRRRVHPRKIGRHWIYSRDTLLALVRP